MEYGYHEGNNLDGQSNYAFFPLLPLTAKLIQTVIGSREGFALVAVSRFFLLGSIFLFMIFVREQNPKVPAWVSGGTVAFNPYSIYGHTGYTETLFLFLFLCVLISFTHKRYILAGIFGALLTATRIPGIFLFVSFLLTCIPTFLKETQENRMSMFLFFCLFPLGIALFSAHLYAVTGDALAWKHIMAAYGWAREPNNPFLHLVNGLRKCSFENSWGIWNIIYCIIIILSFLLIILLFARKRFSLALFSLFATIIPLSTGLASMPRYISLQVGYLLLVSEFLYHSKLYFIVFPLGLILQAIFIYMWLSDNGVYII
jgi:Gpi18-like mannosyltransferase